MKVNSEGRLTATFAEICFFFSFLNKSPAPKFFTYLARSGFEKFQSLNGLSLAGRIPLILSNLLRYFYGSGEKERKFTQVQKSATKLLIYFALEEG